MNYEIEKLGFYPYPLDYYTDKFDLIPEGEEDQVNVFYAITELTPKLYEKLSLIEVKPLLGTPISVRTREITKKGETTSLLIIKNKVNGSSKIEIELPLTEKHKTVLQNELTISSGWKRNRKSFKYKDATVHFNKNTGYGNTVEVEIVVDSEEMCYQANDRITQIFEEFKFISISDSQLDKMYDYYCKHWEYYYNNDQAFIGYFITELNDA